ncbi:DUF1801 domain-containing protein [Dyella ginsengisoli]|jgi:uncharacterized protein YdhG (YjbR/CyaY superfamily)|uniref:DUF1801 domain-containing protein n=1 Tax=Dyella ginsengisoli TaxID=363848 RepID=A0ABW8JTB7_9GAMM
MAEKKSKAKPAAGRAAARSGTSFTIEEQAAMRERAQELKAASRRSTKADDGEGEVLAKIAAMPEPDRTMATRIHAIVRANAPALAPKTWYGMPAYANAAGQVVCFFQGTAKFKTRYATLGFSDKAKLDEGSMWPSAFALKALDVAAEARIAALVARAAG